MAARKLRTRASIFVTCAAIAGGVAGGAIAQDGADLQGLSTDESQAVESASSTQAALRALWLVTAEKAEKGALNADVDQAEAASTLRAAISPPEDPRAAEELQDKMIKLTAILRDSGDLPTLGDHAAYMEYASGGE